MCLVCLGCVVLKSCLVIFSSFFNFSGGRSGVKNEFKIILKNHNRKY